MSTSEEIRELKRLVEKLSVEIRGYSEPRFDTARVKMMIEKVRRIERLRKPWHKVLNELEKLVENCRRVSYSEF